MTHTRVTLNALLIISVFFLNACANQKAEWLNDFDQAQTLATEQNKNIFLFISADWDNKSDVLKETIFNTDVFLKDIAKKYIPVNLDFSSSAYDAAEPAEDATEEEIAAAAKLQSQLQKNAEVASRYSTQSTPAFYLLTSEGYVISFPEYTEEIDEPKEFTSLIAQSDKAAAKINQTIKKIAAAKGVEKARLIDTLFESCDPQFRYLLAEYFEQVLESDPENTTELLGKYEIQIAYSNAMNYYQIKQFELASNVFIDIAQTGHLDEEQLQQAYFLAAALLVESPTAQSDTIVDYLQIAYNIAPDTELALSIQNAIAEVTAENGNQ
jgi:thioredoxin-related protein